MEPKQRYFTALTIAGSDSGGGAGIQADLKTFAALGIFGTSVITAITAQNTHEVRSVEVLSPQIIRTQLQTVLSDITIDAVKTGMLPNAEIIEVVAQTIDQYKLPNLVVDPVLVSTSGSQLTSDKAISAFRSLLYKRATLITPNIPEAARLSGIEINNENDIHRAADVLLAEGCCALLIKGGHRAGKQSTDILFTPNQSPVSFSVPFVKSNNLHGTGCTYASAITACLAQGYELIKSVEMAKSYITAAIEAGKDITTGQGNGPLNHFFSPQPLKTKKI
ncbi:bifunctional hydroxymethylpyrimidine kinase/phosphomethylpyrimidine kinase [Bacteroides sp. 519]|uniref:bifunctional hydroxymethylpyrimidine kinase/phosphomethylpyrimidine kinase n=1 Tax=Bacteroides sp. 519 TaxID=2302937 RepID=UPI0013D6C835|nr:bifunctional hydroxymethylpyrimidine kinase/phosphomethylpyrimidine kinase [Bacteroides sp. 519]NDV59888.1 bifunctional hydroxymethylpyrimidine kinase/phosphomethylpyrimidine kinase [Bacteroides sp. 519]